MSMGGGLFFRREWRWAVWYRVQTAHLFEGKEASISYTEYVVSYSHIDPGGELGEDLDKLRDQEVFFSLPGNCINRFFDQTVEIHSSIALDGNS
jgi:hypothetical protein